MYNLLIADNDVDAWFQVNALLRRYLIKARFVNNLKTAGQYIEQQKPSILFFDKQLQDNSTPDFIRHVKSKFPLVKIILIDTHGEGSIDVRFGADLIISKPLAPEVIERAIIKLLSLQQLQTAYIS